MKSTTILLACAFIASLSFSSPPAQAKDVGEHYATSNVNGIEKCQFVPFTPKAYVACDLQAIEPCAVVGNEIKKETAGNISVRETKSVSTVAGRTIRLCMHKTALAYLITLTTGRNVFYPHVDPGLV